MGWPGIKPDEIAAYEAVVAKTLTEVGKEFWEGQPNIIGLGVKFGARLFFVSFLNYLEQHALSLDDEEGCLSILLQRNARKEFKFISTVALISLPDLTSIFISTGAPEAGYLLLAGIGFASFDLMRDTFILFYKEWMKKKKIEEELEEKRQQEQKEVDFYTEKAQNLFDKFIEYMVARQKVEIEEGEKKRKREKQLAELGKQYQAEDGVDKKIELGRQLGYSDRKIYGDLAKTHHPDRGGNAETMKEINARYNNLLGKFS